MTAALSPVVPYNPGAGQLAVVPKPKAAVAPVAPAASISAWDKRSDAAAWARPDEKPQRWNRRLESVILVALAVIDNSLSYVTYARVRAFHGRMYNIVDLYLTLLPGLDTALLVFALMGSSSFLAMVILVECFKLPLFHEIMNLRLYFSALPCGLICFVLLYHSDQTMWAPCIALIAILFFILAWCLHMRSRWSHQLNTISKILLDVSWFMAFVCGASLVLLFATSSMNVITKSEDLNCPYAANVKMPVKWRVLDKWYCASWDGDNVSGPTMISRAPVNAGSAVELSCSDTFVSAFGVSLEPHTISCPAGCLRTYQGANIIGCGIYSVDSSVCTAAIHAGVLTDAGGQTVVFGRVGVPLFERCSRYSIVSEERYVTRADQAVTLSMPPGSGSSEFYSPTGGSRRLVTAPLVLAADGVQIPQAFHFNNQAHTREFIWLKSFHEVSTKDPGVEEGKPWSRIVATVTAQIAGMEIEDDEVRLGESPYQPLFVNAAPGQIFEEAPAECRVRSTGVYCRGTGSALAQLNFCRTEEKTCL